MASLSSSLCLQLLFSLLLLFTCSTLARTINHKKHSSSLFKKSPKTQVEELIKQLNLFPKRDVNIIPPNYFVEEEEPRIVEKRLNISLLGDFGTTPQDLGHHAGYYKLSNTKDARMFYFFFESRNKNNTDDPVVIWLTGGPGCSSELALFYENGPYKIANNMSLSLNDFGWDKMPKRGDVEERSPKRKKTTASARRRLVEGRNTFELRRREVEYAPEAAPEAAPEVSHEEGIYQQWGPLQYEEREFREPFFPSIESGQGSRVLQQQSGQGSGQGSLFREEAQEERQEEEGEEGEEEEVDDDDDDEDEVEDLLDIFNESPKRYKLYNNEIKHVSNEIKAGEDERILTCKQSATKMDKWNLEDESEAVQNIVKASSLYKLVDSYFFQINKVLINAFVERWAGETNTFHLPFGEMTITLDDVHQLLGLPITGKRLAQLGEHVNLNEKKAWVEDMLGISHDDIHAELHFGKKIDLTSVRTQWLIDHLSCNGKHHHRVHSTDEQIARGYLLTLLGCTLFHDMSHVNVKLRYLHYLEDLSQEGLDSWAWGAGALAYTYRMLGKASIEGTKGVGGYLTLLEAWIYEHFPGISEAGNPYRVKAGKARTTRWNTSVRKNIGTLGILLKKKRQAIDDMKASDVNWSPYREIGEDPSPVVWFYGILEFDQVLEPYHPNRVVRQFGRVQDIPHIPIMPAKSHVRATKGYKAYYERSLATCFDDFSSYLIPDHIKGAYARSNGECTKEYITWYKRAGGERLFLAKEERGPSSYESATKSAAKMLRDMMKAGLKKIQKAEMWTTCQKTLDVLDGAIINDGRTQDTQADTQDNEGREGARGTRREPEIGIRIQEPSDRQLVIRSEPEVRGKGKEKVTEVAHKKKKK